MTGGYFADPGVNDVPGLADLGFPFADVGVDGRVEISKVAGTGGCVNVRTCTEQLLYEVHDPARYVTPNAVVDFSRVGFTEVGESRVAVHGVDAGPPPATLKVSVGSVAGFVGEGEISYAGPGCVARADLALEILEKRLRDAGLDAEQFRFERIGIDATAWCQRAPFRTTSPRCGSASPAGCAPKPTPSGSAARSPGCGSTARPVAAGRRRTVTEEVAIRSTTVPRASRAPRVEWVEV